MGTGALQAACPNISTRQLSSAVKRQGARQKSGEALRPGFDGTHFDSVQVNTGVSAPSACVSPRESSGPERSRGTARPGEPRRPGGIALAAVSRAREAPACHVRVAAAHRAGPRHFFSSCLHFLLDSLRRGRPLRVRTPARLASFTALVTLWRAVASRGKRNVTRPSDRPPWSRTSG